jgi:hypothetical protein
MNLEQCISYIGAAAATEVPEFRIPMSPKLIAEMSLAANAHAKNRVLICGGSVYATMIADSDFYSLIDPYGEKEIVDKGVMAVLFGMDILTPAFYHPNTQTELNLPRDYLGVVSVDSEGKLVHSTGCLVSGV